ncbi:type VI secretion system baseplate subunit TssG [Spirosoma soli]|uniref:Type VI secretion system baseplate subunit TssG n=1 Tax=Spirosoma soli TaxID=1770529 RepID=A0ABW5M644_9BACT
MRFLYDIRAEVWIADHYRTTTLPTEVFVRPKGTFSRSYSADVLKAETYEADTQHPLTHVLHLSREGLYDSLPETLHHPPAPPLRAGRDEARAMLEQSKRLRHEENEARTFWLPFEQESFRQRVQIEDQEAQALTRAYGPIWDELHGYLWGELPMPLSPRQRACLLAIWTNAHRVAGDWERTAFYFEEFLQVAVWIRYGTFTDATATKGTTVAQSVTLGNGRLGQDWVVDPGNLVDDGGTVRLSIEPLTDEELTHYLPNGLGLAYIKLLADYLLPADADWQLEVRTNKVEGSFQLVPAGTAGRLGLTTTLS